MRETIRLPVGYFDTLGVAEAPLEWTNPATASWSNGLMIQ